MPIGFPTWVATGSTYVQQKFSLLTQEAANTRDKVLSVAIRFFSFLITTIYSFFYPQPFDNSSNNDVPEQTTIPDDTSPSEATHNPTPRSSELETATVDFPISEQHQDASSGATDKSASIPPKEQVEQQEDSTPLDNIAALATSLQDVVVQSTGSPQQQATTVGTPTSPPPTPVAVRNVPLVATPSSPKLTSVRLVAPSNPFLELKITDEEKIATSAFIKKSADISTWKAFTLLPESKHVKRTYKHIHTLRSLAHFVTDPTTKKHLQTIMSNSTKRAGYLNDFNDRMGKLVATKDKNIDPYLPGFCEFVKGDFGQVNSLLCAKNYAGFIDYLLALK